MTMQAYLMSFRGASLITVFESDGTNAYKIKKNKKVSFNLSKYRKLTILILEILRLYQYPEKEVRSFVTTVDMMRACYCLHSPTGN